MIRHLGDTVGVVQNKQKHLPHPMKNVLWI